MTRKNKRRQQRRQRQDDEALSSITDTDLTDGSWKPAGYPRARRSFPRPQKLPFPEKSHVNPITVGCHRDCAEPCQQYRYDAVILHSVRDGKDALVIKKWLEENLELKHSHSKHPPMIELMGNLHSSYVESLEIASKRTETIIILCSKHFSDDALFRNAIHALWAWKAVRDFEIFPLLFGFEEGEAAPECIPLRESHVVHFKANCQYFRNRMSHRLSHTLAKRLRHDEKRRQCERRQQETDVRQFCHPSTSVGDGECTPVSNQGGNAEEREVAHYTPDPYDRDSGIASDATARYSTFMSALASLPVTVNFPPQRQDLSLSGPFGLQHEPYLTSADTVSSSTEPQSSIKTSQVPSTQLQGAFGATISVEDTRLQVQIGDVGKTDPNKDTHLESPGEACQNKPTGEAASASSTRITNDDSGFESTAQIQAGHREERRVLTKHRHSELPSATFADNEHSYLSDSASYVRRSVLSSVNDPPVLTHSNIKETLKCDEAAESKIIDQVVKLDDVPKPEHIPELKKGQGKQTDDTNFETGDEQLCDSVQNSVAMPAAHSQVDFETSSSETSQRNVGVKSSAEHEPETRSKKGPSREGYLTPVSCSKPSCSHETVDPEDSDFDSLVIFQRDEDTKLLDQGSFASNNFSLVVDLNPLEAFQKTTKLPHVNLPDTEDIHIEKQKQLMSAATATPPKHSYINPDREKLPEDQAPKKPPSTVPYYPASLSVCNPIPVCRSYAGTVRHDTPKYLTVPNVAEPRVDHLGTISIHQAENVIIHNGHCHSTTLGVDGSGSCPVQSIRDGMDTDYSRTTAPCQTWPRHPFNSSDKPAADRTISGPVLPPRNSSDKGGKLTVPTAIKPRSSRLSVLKLLFCCSRRNTEKNQEVEVDETDMSYVTENPYDCVEDIQLPLRTCCSPSAPHLQ